VVGAALAAAAFGADAPDTWQATHDALVARLEALRSKTAAFGPAYASLYDAALPWYKTWGGINRDPVDSWMVGPEDYAASLADAIEHGRNFIADDPDGLFPLVFETTLASGEKVSSKYWLKLPAGFPNTAATYPLIVGLHGSGWLGHKISYVKGKGAGGPFIEVTPIDEAGPWKIDYLNRFLDRLIETLPVDKDRIYVEGHSLGAMATWEWALDNPERFAAISPRAGVGEPFRAIRLKNVPSWSIHGEKDDVVPRGFEEEMVSALQAVGSSARYTVLKGGLHNMPADLDEKAVTDWYLRQKRSHEPPPPDPIDALGITPQGFSVWVVIHTPEVQAWKGGSVNLLGKRDKLRAADLPLFERVHARGEIVDAPIRYETDPATFDGNPWLAAPASLQTAKDPDPSLTTIPAGTAVRFYFRGSVRQALDHLKTITPFVVGSGHALSQKVWITPLTLWMDSPDFVAEYWVPIP
jgi:acetyl esterase/lipase